MSFLYSYFWPTQPQTKVKKSKISAYPRVLFHAKDVVNPSPGLGSVLDPLHHKMLTFGGGLYTQAEIDQIKLDAFSFFLKRYGLDFTTATYDPTIGSYSLAGYGTLYPYATGDDYLYRLAYDSTNSSVGKKQNHIIFDCGLLMVMSGDGIFPGGEMGGTEYKNSWIVGYTFYNYLDTDHPDQWTQPGTDTRESVLTLSKWPVISQANSQGLTEQFIKEEVVLADGTVGFLTNMVTYTRIDENTVVQSTRATLTFPQIGNFPPPPTPKPEVTASETKA